MEADRHLSPEGWHGKCGWQAEEAKVRAASCASIGSLQPPEQNTAAQASTNRHSLPAVLAAGSQTSRSRKVGFLQKRPRLPTQSHCEVQGARASTQELGGGDTKTRGRAVRCSKHGHPVLGLAVSCFPLILLSLPL